MPLPRATWPKWRLPLIINLTSILFKFKIHSEVAILAPNKWFQTLTHGSYNSNRDCYEFLTRSSRQSLPQVLPALFKLQGVMRSCHASPFRTMNMLLSRPLVNAANPFGRNIQKPKENDWEWLADTKLGFRPLAEWWPTVYGSWTCNCPEPNISWNYCYVYIYIYEIIWVYIRNCSRWEWMISNIECSRSLVILIVIVTVDILIYYSRLSNGCLVLTVVLDFDRKVKVKQDACEIIFEIRPRKLWRCVPLSKVIVNCAWYTCFTG